MRVSGDSGGSDLASRLDKLEQLCARLVRENSELRERVTQQDAASVRDAEPARDAGPAVAVWPMTPAARPALAASGQAPAQQDTISRRMIGRKLGIAAAGVVGAAALTEKTGVFGYTDSSDGFGVVGINNNLAGPNSGAAVFGHALKGGVGVHGSATAGAARCSPGRPRKCSWCQGRGRRIPVAATAVISMQTRTAACGSASTAALRPPGTR